LRYANPKPGGHVNAHYYAIQITALLFLDKPRGASESVVWGCQR